MDYHTGLIGYVLRNAVGSRFSHEMELSYQARLPALTAKTIAKLAANRRKEIKTFVREKIEYFLPLMNDERYILLVDTSIHYSSDLGRSNDSRSIYNSVEARIVKKIQNSFNHQSEHKSEQTGISYQVKVIVTYSIQVSEISFENSLRVNILSIDCYQVKETYISILSLT